MLKTIIIGLCLCLSLAFAESGANQTWEAFQINRYINVATANKTEEHAYSGNLLKYGSSVLYNIGNVKNRDRFQLSEGTNRTEELNDFVKQTNDLFNNIEKLIESENYTKFISDMRCRVTNLVIVNLTRITVVSPDISLICADEIARHVSDDDGVLIILDVDEELSAVKQQPLLLEKIMASNGLIHDKSNILSSIISPQIYKVFRVYATVKLLSDHLYEFVKSLNFNHFMDLCESIYEKNLDISIIKTVVTQMIYDGNENVLPLANMLKLRRITILNKCFPDEIVSIVLEKKVGLMNRLIYKTGLLMLSNNTNAKKDRWLQLDCSYASKSNSNRNSNSKAWEFIPVWSNGKLLFRLRQLHYRMDLKVDYNTIRNSTDRLVWGNHLDEKFYWRLVPVAKSSFRYPQFCLVNPVSNQLLASDYCEYKSSQNVNVKVVDGICTHALGWYVRKDI